MKYTNDQIARNEDLWDEYYNTNGLCPFGSLSLDERLANLNRDYPDISSAAATLGRKGGKSTSESKKTAVRENGRKGGRPMKRYDLYIDNMPQGKEVLAATPASAARKVGLKDWHERDGRIWWDEDGKHYEVIPEEKW